MCVYFVPPEGLDSAEWDEWSQRSMDKYHKKQHLWTMQCVCQLQAWGLERPIKSGKATGYLYSDEWMVEYQCYARLDHETMEWNGIEWDVPMFLDPQSYNEKYNEQPQLLVGLDGRVHFEDEYFFRVLRNDEDPRCGISAKRPDAIGDAQEQNKMPPGVDDHVVLGSRGLETEYISASASYQKVKAFRDLTGPTTSKIVAISVPAIKERVFLDKLYVMGRTCGLTSRCLEYARRWDEVVLEGFVPPYAVHLVPDVNPIPRAPAPVTPRCKMCKGTLVPRTNRKTGRRFLGCENFSSADCRYTQSLGCYIPDTLVKTSASTYTCVQALSAGDAVLSSTGQLLRVVYQKTHEEETRTIIKLCTREADLKVTDDHRIVVPDEHQLIGDVPARELKTGDIVFCG